MKLINEVSESKLRGGYYTPEIIANFILRWGVSNKKFIDILEPSCGDGVFIDELRKIGFKYNTLTGIELDPIEAEKAKQINLEKQIYNQDFHKYCNNTNSRFDLIVGNPPYIRFQFFNKDQQAEADLIFKKAGLKYSKLTNAWVSFVVGSSLLLKESGRIGFVLPAEVLQVSYAQQLREFLASFYNKITIISFQKLVFPDIQQEIVILLCERNNSTTHNIDHIELKDADCLSDVDIKNISNANKQIDFSNNKWTFYFLNQDEIDFLENVSSLYKIPKIGDYASVEVGITTGANSFFTVPLSTVNEYNLHSFAKPLVGRSVQVDSLIFNDADWLRNRDSNTRSHLLVFPTKEALTQSDNALKYIERGELNGIDKGYKCGIRDNWFTVPSLKISDALFIRRNSIYPKLIINQAEAYTTDTMHRVFVNKTTNTNAFIASYYNSLSFAFAEVCGRSHGGGVLELMPNETENILLPYDIVNESLVHTIDDLIRRKVDIDEILKITNNIILKQHYNLNDVEINMAHNIWKKLMTRRLNRGKKF